MSRRCIRRSRRHNHYERQSRMTTRLMFLNKILIIIYVYSGPDMKNNQRVCQRLKNNGGLQKSAGNQYTHIHKWAW